MEENRIYNIEEGQKKKYDHETKRIKYEYYIYKYE